MGTRMRHLIFAMLGLAATTARADYAHELFGYLDYTSGTGAISSGETKTDIKDGAIKGSLGYGYFMSESVEPVFDFTINNQEKTVGSYTNTWGNTEWSLGVIFNRPDGGSANVDKEGKRKKSEEEGPLASSKWIPYGGFLLASRSNTQSLGESSGTESALITKLIAGCRYMIFPHIGFNFWLKISYENSSATATSTEDNKGGISKLNLEFRLFSVSVFF